MKQILQNLWRSAVNFVYPPACIICKIPLTDASGLCDSCHERLVLWNPELHPVNFIEKFHQITVLYDFNDDVRDLVHLLKYRGKTLPGKLLGRDLGARLAQDLETGWVIIPVPLHSSKKRLRGYNQSEIIAKAAGRFLGWQVMPQALKRIKATTTQTQLNVKERKENVKRAFRVSKPCAIAGQKVVLVDDVITTGATLEACAQALIDAGAKKVSVGVIACPNLTNTLPEHAVVLGA